MQLIHNLFRCALIEGTPNDVAEGERRLCSFYANEEKGKAVANLIKIATEWDKLIEADKEPSKEFMASVWEANQVVGNLFVAEVISLDPMVARDIIRSLPDCYAKDQLSGYNNKRRSGATEEELKAYLVRIFV